MTYELIDNVTLNTVGSFEDLGEAFDAWMAADPPQDLVLVSFDGEGNTLGARVFGSG